MTFTTHQQQSIGPFNIQMADVKWLCPAVIQVLSVSANFDPLNLELLCFIFAGYSNIK